MTPELVEFLLACIAEDERAARAAMIGCIGHEHWQVVRDSIGDRAGAVVVYGTSVARPTVEHIAPHDPARVLAECEAKRQLIELAEDAEALDNQVWNEYGLSSDPGYNDPRVGERILRAMALPYADHTDWREEWRP